MEKRLFRDLRLILLRYEVIHMRDDDGRDRNFVRERCTFVRQNSLILAERQVIYSNTLCTFLTNDNRTNIIPPTNYLLMILT